MIKGIKPQLAQAGAIKIGRLGDERPKKGGGTFRLPVKLDHFLVVKNTRIDGQLEIDDAVMRALPADTDGKVRTIPIVLHSDAIDEVFPTVYAFYKGQKVACRGDGEKATQWKFEGNKRLNENRERQCPCELLDENKCKPHGTLHCSIVLPGHAIAGAVYRWRTTGIISIQRMIGSLEQILAVVGTLQNIPLLLKVQPVQVTPQGKTQTVYSCHVELHASDLLAVQQHALEAREARKLLGPAVEIKALLRAPASDDESPEEQAEVQEEFFPPSDVTDAVDGALKESTQESVKKAAKKTAESKEQERVEKTEALEKKLEDVADVEDDNPDYGEPDGVEF